MAQAPEYYRPNYDDEKSKQPRPSKLANLSLAKCVDFIGQFEDPSLEADVTHEKKKYLIQMQEVANDQAKQIQIEIGDLEQHFRGDRAFVERITKNAKRYISLFSEAIDELMPERTVNPSEEAEGSVSFILNRQRREEHAG